MHLELSSRERIELTAVLDARLTELQREIFHTDNRSFRAALKERLDTLEALRRRLDTGAVEEQVYA